MKSSVVLLQSDPGIAQSLTTSLLSSFRSVHVAGSTDELRASILKHRARVVILDMEMASLPEVERLSHEFPGLSVVCTHRLADEEIRRFEYKVEAGAEYAVTQPVFDLGLLEAFLRRIEHCRIPVVAGIWPLVSVRNAEFMKNELRVSVPNSVLDRMAQAKTPEAAREEGIAIAREMLVAVRDMVQGAQISAPLGRYASAVDVLEALGSSRPATA